MGFPIKIDLIELSNLINERWPRKSTIVILILLSIIILLFLAINIPLVKIGMDWWIIIILIPCTLLSIWLVTNKVPTNKKDKVGILIAISHEDKSKQNNFRNDFIQVLADLLQKGNMCYKFKLIELNEYHSSKITNEETTSKYLRKSRCHFILYGRIKERKMKGDIHHFLNLDGIVSHRPIPMEVSKQFSEEFSTVLPRKLSISREGDVFAFEFTAQWTDFVSRYIIGIASLLSGDHQYAINLFEDLKTKLDSINIQVPPIIIIKTRLPDRLEKAYEREISLHYDRWMLNRDTTSLVALEPTLNKLLKIRPRSYYGHSTAAICAFVLRRDIKKAREEIKECKGVKDKTWYYSKAFLDAYQARMGAAESAYQTAFSHPSSDLTVPLQIEQFIVDILNQEPDKVQLYYCLGLINYGAKNDMMSAKRDFDEFLNRCPEELFPEQITKAKEYIQQIEEIDKKSSADINETSN